MASLTLQNIRDITRVTLDLEEEDLPDLLIDSWAQEAYDLSIGAETDWAFFEGTATLGVTADVQSYPLSDITIDGSPIQDIYGIRGERYDLIPVAERLATKTWRRDTVNTSEPTYWSQWDESIHFWPIPNDTYTFEIRGYREPLDWITDGAGAVPDCPAPFHRVLLSWVISKAYLQQDDPGMGQQFEIQYANQLRALMNRFKGVHTAGPLILNGGEPPAGPFDRLWYEWE